ncbi:hypothetical protein Btru_065392 [Bulinus truncatus]|nr:hypothetical protein Btru_065392 [Bulinus truncatus]
MESEEKWEETILMLELPELDNKRSSESYLQILGLSTESPLVKINNQLYSGKMTNTLGSHLFLEIEDNSAGKDAKTKKKDIKNVIVTDKSLKLEPVYLERKTSTKGDSSSKE